MPFLLFEQYMPGFQDMGHRQIPMPISVSFWKPQYIFLKWWYINKGLTAGIFDDYKINDLHSHLFHKVSFLKLDERIQYSISFRTFLYKSINYKSKYGIHVLIMETHPHWRRMTEVYMNYLPVQYGEDLECLGSVVNPIWLLTTIWTVPCVV